MTIGSVVNVFADDTGNDGSTDKLPDTEAHIDGFRCCTHFEWEKTDC
jgi:hypothetical protein